MRGGHWGGKITPIGTRPNKSSHPVARHPATVLPHQRAPHNPRGLHLLYSQVVRHHLARSAFPRLLGRLVNEELEEAFERFGCCQLDPQDSSQIMTGVALASLPTSSSICMIFFILACGLAFRHGFTSFEATILRELHWLCARGLAIVLLSPKCSEVFFQPRRSLTHILHSDQPQRTFFVQDQTIDREIGARYSRRGTACQFTSYSAKLTRDVFDRLLTFGGMLVGCCGCVDC